MPSLGPDQPAQWTGHVVVCGLHGDGVRVVEQLHLAGVPVVVVDDEPDSRLVHLITGPGVPYLTGDSRLPGTLTAAGVRGAAALICAESDDLHTLATALLARELRADVRIVVALQNAAVGRALQRIGVSVLDVAALSAPSLVEACVGAGRHPVRLGELELVLAETTCAQYGTLRELYGDLAPIGVVPGGSGQVEVAPGRDLEIEPGDTVVVLGEPAAIEQAGIGAVAGETEPVFVGARAPRESKQRPTTLLRFMIGNADRRLKQVLLALAVLIMVSVLVLRFGYREADGRQMTLLDAIYFTIETIGTVGYGDFYFRDQPAWLRIWAIVLMIIGATMATIFFALLTNVLISRTIASTLGRRKITGLTDHVVVIGVGSVGFAVVEGLRAAGTDVVVVEADEDNRFLAALRQRGVPVITADATLPETFEMVRLAHAKAVAVLTSDDLVNIETGLAVRDLLGDRWAEVPVVLRMFDRRLADTVAGSFDFRWVRSTAALAAPWFVGAALGLDVLGTCYVRDQPMLVASLPVGPGSHLDGLAMREIGARVRVVALLRADQSVEYPPRRDTRFAGGDLAYLIGPYEELLAVLRRG